MRRVAINQIRVNLQSKQTSLAKPDGIIPAQEEYLKDNIVEHWVHEYSGTSKPRILSNALEAAELWSDINYNGTTVKFSLTPAVDVMIHRDYGSGDSVVGQFRLHSICL